MNMFKCPGLSLNFTLKSRSRSAPPSTLDPSSPERQIYRSALTLIPHPRRAHLCWAEEQEEYTSAGSIDLPLPPRHLCWTEEQEEYTSAGVHIHHLQQVAAAAVPCPLLHSHTSMKKFEVGLTPKH